MIAGHSTHVDALSHGQISVKAGSSPNEHCGPITCLCGCCGSERDISELFFAQLKWTNLWCTWKSEPLEKSLKVCHALSLPKWLTNVNDCHPK